MATTAGGLPYVESSDLISGYPTVSQALAEELDDQLAAKATKTSSGTAPSSPATGDIWYDTGTTPPTAKFYDGSAWQTFSAGAAVISGTPTGTYTDAGIDYAYYTFTASGGFTVTKAGLADIFCAGGGGSGGGSADSNKGGGGGAGGYRYAYTWVPAGYNSVYVGAGGAASATLSNDGTPSRLAQIIIATGGGGGGGSSSILGGGGASGGGGRYNAAGGKGQSAVGQNGGTASTSVGGGGGGRDGTGASGASGGAGGVGRSVSLTGSSVTYCAGGSGNGGSAAGSANTGNGGDSGASAAGGAGGSGIVIVRVVV